MPEAAATTTNFNPTACNVFMCKGLANVQTFNAGQVVNMLASIPIPHEGPMNVSVINTQTNTAIGAPLISFDSYADESLATLPANNTNFNVTIPTTLGSQCATAGVCALQWFWFGRAAVQTYESCVDMVVADASTDAISATLNDASANLAVSTAAARKMLARGSRFRA